MVAGDGTMASGDGKPGDGKLYSRTREEWAFGEDGVIHCWDYFGSAWCEDGVEDGTEIGVGDVGDELDEGDSRVCGECVRLWREEEEMVTAENPAAYGVDAGDLARMMNDPGVVLLGEADGVDDASGKGEMA